MKEDIFLSYQHSPPEGARNSSVKCPWHFGAALAKFIFVSKHINKGQEPVHAYLYMYSH